MTKAIDFGNYTAIPTPEQVRCLLDAGYTKAIIGTSYGNVWRDQIAACEAGGMDVENYCFPTRATWIRPWWLDCETPEATVDLIRSLCEAEERQPKRPQLLGIYTRRGWWVDNTGDWDIKAEFPWLKLWDAAYADPPRPFVPYGGFTERAIHQWHDSTTLCDLNVDLNIVEEEQMPTQEYDELYQRDEDIKKVVANEAAATDFLIEAVNAMAAQVYGDNDPRTLDLKQRVDALEKGK